LLEIRAYPYKEKASDLINKIRARVYLATGLLELHYKYLSQHIRSNPSILGNSLQQAPVKD
jgi:hypothetical protein